jgi:allophanate hydrolase
MPTETPTAADRVRAAYARIAAAERPEVWITLRDEAGALADAAALDALDDDARAALPTTAACPAYAFVPETTAPAVARLVDAGAIVLGKTNLDQFATGLTGTRSPHGAVRDALRPDHASGGASAGSAVAVALGLVDLAVGTDAGGGGRVPAAFGGIAGIKATRGIVPVRGAVPGLRGLDCVTILAPDLARAARAIALMAGPDAEDPLSRAAPPGAPAAAPPAPRVAVPGAGGLDDLTDAARAAFAAAAARLEGAGARLVAVELAPFLEAGRLLDDGALVADRYAAVGEFVDAHPDAVDPTVGAIVRAAGDLTATQYLRDAERADALKAQALTALRDAGADALLLPTTTAQPTLAAVAADPVGTDHRLGIYTTFGTLFDMPAVAVPAGRADGGAFGVSVLAEAFHDRVALDVARLLGDTPPPRLAPPGAGASLPA